MILELTEQERDALANLLEVELAKLPVEIHRTERRDYRDALEAREETLRAIQDRVQTHVTI